MVSSCKQTFSYLGVNFVLITLHFRIIAYDEKLSVMLSEVPWMKFRVIAEPDFSVFTRHPVMQSTLTQIATTTVEHVTAKFEALMALALAETVQIVTQSAMDHVQEPSLVVLTQNLSAASGAHAHLHETLLTLATSSRSIRFALYCCQSQLSELQSVEATACIIEHCLPHESRRAGYRGVLAKNRPYRNRAQRV